MYRCSECVVQHVQPAWFKMWGFLPGLESAGGWVKTALSLPLLPGFRHASEALCIWGGMFWRGLSVGSHSQAGWLDHPLVSSACWRPSTLPSVPPPVSNSFQMMSKQPELPQLSSSHRNISAMIQEGGGPQHHRAKGLITASASEVRMRSRFVFVLVWSHVITKRESSKRTFLSALHVYISLPYIYVLYIYMLWYYMLLYRPYIHLHRQNILISKMLCRSH